MELFERRFLIGLTGFEALMAIAGGIGLMINGLGMPLEYLHASPFSSYFWPGIILMVALGVTNTIAAVLLLRRHTWGLASAALGAVAAFGWIIGEQYVTPVTNWMQLFVAGVAATQIALVLLLLGVLSRERRQLWTR